MGLAARWRSARWSADLWDAAVAAVLYGTLLALPVLAPRAELAPVTLPVALQGFFVCAPLVVRRRWPVPVLAVVVAAIIIALNVKLLVDFLS